MHNLQLEHSRTWQGLRCNGLRFLALYSLSTMFLDGVSSSSVDVEPIFGLTFPHLFAQTSRVEQGPRVKAGELGLESLVGAKSTKAPMLR